MKKISLLLLIAVLVMGWSHWGRELSVPLPLDELGLLQTALRATGAAPLTGELQAWVQVRREKCSLPQVEATLEGIASAFGLSRHEYDILTRSTGEYTWSSLDSALPDGGYLRLTVYSLGQATTAEVSIFNCPAQAMAQCHSQLKRALTLAGASGENVSITLCLEGSVNDRLRGGEKLNTVYSAFAAIGAIYRGAVEANGISQWSAWSNRLSAAVAAGEKQVNFGLSLYWDASAAKTVIRVATPVIPSY